MFWKRKECSGGFYIGNSSSAGRRESCGAGKVLSRYQIDPADSLKYRAACFLIENMPYYTYYKGKQLDRYFTYYALLQKTRGLGISPQVVADSVRHMYGPLYLDSLQSYRDRNS